MGIGSSKFDPDRDIPSLEGKAILVTGGNNGLGKETCLQLAKHKPRLLLLTSRTRSKGEAAIKEIHAAAPDAAIELLDLDLASFSSIRAAADTIKSKTDRLDILINNAGVMCTPPTKTSEGYELQWGTNHMGHALLSKLLMPLLEKTASEPDSDVRIVTLASGAAAMTASTGLNLSNPSLPSSNPWTRYGHSKLANILYTQQLAKHHPSIMCVSVHPGVVKTNLGNSMAKLYPVLTFFFGIVSQLFMKTVERGAWNQLWAATVQRERLKSGQYYVPVGKEAVGNRKWGRDEKLAGRLWDYTQEELKKHGFE